MTTEEHFASAVANTDEVGGATVGAVSGCSGLSANDSDDKQTLQNTKKAVLLGESNTALVPPQGVALSAKTSGKTHLSKTGGATVGAVGDQNSPIDPDLQSVIDAWPALSDAAKAEIVAMIRADVGVD